MGDFAVAPVEDEPFTDEELRVQVRVLKADVKTLTGAVHELRDKHNVLLAETGGAFAVIDQSFIAEELRWDVCEKELHGISQELARHSAIFVDCETYIKAQLTMAAERMKFHEEDLRKLSETMNDKAAYVQDRFIPDAMDDCQKKLDADMDAFKKGWLPTAVTEMEQVISGKIYDTLHKTFDANIKDLIEGRVAAANAELTNNLKTVSEVSEANFLVLEQKVLAGCPCANDRCPCRCNQPGAGGDAPQDPFQGEGCPWSQNLAGSHPSRDRGARPQVFPMTPTGHGRAPGRGGAPGGDGGPGRDGPAGGDAGARGGTPHAPPGIGPNITMTSRVFEEKTAKDASFQYDGVNRGATWRSDVADYFISKCPDGMPWLDWVESQGAVEITREAIDQEKRDHHLMTEFDPYVLSHHMWGFLQLCLTGAARQTFKNTGKRDGFNVWRALVLKINSQTACRRHGLRDRVQLQQQVENIEQIEPAIVSWETLYSEYLAAGGDTMKFEDRRSQLLRILPTALRRDVFRKIDDFTDISQIKEWIRVQLELEREWHVDDQVRRGRPRAAVGTHNLVINPEPEQLEFVEEAPTEEDMMALCALGPNSTMAEILAIQNRFKRFGARAPFRRSPGGAAPAGARAAALPDAGPGRLPGAAKTGTVRCVNCGRTNHETRDCREARKAKHERPCWNCGKSGHMAHQCPEKGTPAKVAEAVTGSSPVVNFGCIWP